MGKSDASTVKKRAVELGARTAGGPLGDGKKRIQVFKKGRHGASSAIGRTREFFK